MLRPDRRPLWHLTAHDDAMAKRFLSDADGRVDLNRLADLRILDAPDDAMLGRSVLISSTRQLPAVLALLRLDGIARRVLLCPPDLASEHLAGILADGEVDTIVSDGTGPAGAPVSGLAFVRCVAEPASAAPLAAPLGAAAFDTEWLLLTSGTTGRPKLVVHSLASLTGPLNDGLTTAAAVWSTFYDVRRYGGLQILLRALLGGGCMVLSQSGEAVGDFLARAAAARVTHMSGTPSHWRGALMSGARTGLMPAYVRLSGEVADQAILDNLAAAFPLAQVAHAFASTEAGVAFDVRDGLAGFPATLIGGSGAAAELRVKDGSLRIRSGRTASRYLADGAALADADGFVDTGDMVERRGDRYHFIGRREGIINVGGQKVHPEEVEAVLNRHPAVRMARVRGRRSPIMGAIVVADVVLNDPASPDGFQAVSASILEACRATLPAHKVPTMLRQVPSLEISSSGKLARPAAGRRHA